MSGPLDPENILQIQHDRLIEIGRLVRPWVSGQPIQEPVFKLVNNLSQSLHVETTMEGGTVIFTFVPRTPNPGENVLIVPPGDSRVIDPNGGSNIE